MELSKVAKEIADGFIGDNEFYLDKSHYTSNFLVILASYLKSYKQVPKRNFTCEHDSVRDYLEAIGFFKAIWNEDSYDKERVNQGINYSVITCLDSEMETDQVSTQINSCIRNFFGPELSSTSGVAALTHVVGELHDNVWSHGKKTGFSHVQKKAVPNSNGTDFFLEFAIADSGFGFLSETKRVGMQFGDDLEALKWCLKEGNSTKHSSNRDEWSQSLPSDHLGVSPFGSGISVKYSENNHQGLGLFHLEDLVKKYKGQMHIISGHACYSVTENGESLSKVTKEHWQGVAISCKFKKSELTSIVSEMSEDEANIIDLLTWRGSYENE